MSCVHDILRRVFGTAALVAKPTPTPSPTLSETNLHSHECPSCKTMWRHDPETIPDDKRHEAHSCPRCGARQFEWYQPGSRGRDAEEVPAAFCHNGVRTIEIETPPMEISPLALAIGEARRGGFEAYERGEGPGDNPHYFGPEPLYQSWKAGWLDAEIDNDT